MIRREFLMVSSVSALAAAVPAAWGRSEPGRRSGVAGSRPVPAARQWQAERMRIERGIPSRQERYRWQL